MRKHYAVAGIVVAILVAALVVVAGSRSSDDGASGGAHKAGAAAEPSAAVTSAGSGTASPTDYAAVVKLLEARHPRNPSDTKTAMDLANAYFMTEQPLKAGGCTPRC